MWWLLQFIISFLRNTRDKFSKILKIPKNNNFHFISQNVILITTLLLFCLNTLNNHLDIATSILNYIAIYFDLQKYEFVISGSEQLYKF